MLISKIETKSMGTLKLYLATCMAFQQCLHIVSCIATYVLNHTNLIVNDNIITNIEVFQSHLLCMTRYTYSIVECSYSLKFLILVENKGPSGKNTRKGASNQRRLKSIQCHLCYSSRSEVMSYLYYYSYTLAIVNLLIIVLVIIVYSRYLCNE